jgi:hypothetical protein
VAKCKSPRKGIKRAQRRPQAADRDGELDELASVIAEYSLDNNAGGWFRPAWRDGWNAVELASTIAYRDERCEPTFGGWLRTVCTHRSDDHETYWRAQDLLATSPSPMFRAAFRCLQILIAKSAGGGEVYNAILVGPVSRMLPEAVYDLVLEYRCRDSIGTTAQLAGDINDRQRRAFTIAWKRGLYQAAYALPPAIKHDVGKLTIVKGAKSP